MDRGSNRGAGHTTKSYVSRIDKLARASLGRGKIDSWLGELISVGRSACRIGAHRNRIVRKMGNRVEFFSTGIDSGDTVVRLLVRWATDVKSSSTGIESGEAEVWLPRRWANEVEHSSTKIESGNATLWLPVRWATEVRAFSVGTNLLDPKVSDTSKWLN